MLVLSFSDIFLWFLSSLKSLLNILLVVLEKETLSAAEVDVLLGRVPAPETVQEKAPAEADAPAAEAESVSAEPAAAEVAETVQEQQ